jgi:hypothetical protein
MKDAATGHAPALAHTVTTVYGTTNVGAPVGGMDITTIAARARHPVSHLNPSYRVQRYTSFTALLHRLPKRRG